MKKYTTYCDGCDTAYSDADGGLVEINPNQHLCKACLKKIVDRAVYRGKLRPDATLREVVDESSTLRQIYDRT